MMYTQEGSKVNRTIIQTTIIGVLSMGGLKGDFSYEQTSKITGGAMASVMNANSLNTYELNSIAARYNLANLPSLKNFWLQSVNLAAR